MNVTQPKGWLVIIGGAEDKQAECVILSEFVRLAGGKNARIVVMTVATALFEERGRDRWNDDDRRHLYWRRACRARRHDGPALCANRFV